jgi:hypothetical protein
LLLLFLLWLSFFLLLLSLSLRTFLGNVMITLQVLRI